jgi:copper chaperone CopZ
MTLAQIVVTVVGVAAGAWVLWYFVFAPGPALAATAKGGVQEVRITVKGGYTPDTVVVRAGKPVRLLFYRDETAGAPTACAEGSASTAPPPFDHRRRPHAAAAGFPVPRAGRAGAWRGARHDARRSPPAQAPWLKPMAKTRIVLPIEGMSCAACARTVQDALRGTPGVAAATVNYATAKAAVDYDDGATGVVGLVQTVRQAGYGCGTATVQFQVADLHYAASVAPLDAALAAVPGVLRAAANQATESVTVDYVPGATSAEALEGAVRSAGFQVAAPIPAEDPVERERIARSREVRTLTWKFALAAGGGRRCSDDVPPCTGGRRSAMDASGVLMPLGRHGRRRGPGWVIGHGGLGLLA